MIRKFLVCAAVAASAFALAPVAAADPVEDFDDDAELGEECDSWVQYIFGSGPDGEPLACVSNDGVTGQWVTSVPLVGERPIGSPCIPSPGGVQTEAAQAPEPDGRPLLCVAGQGWQPA